MDKIARLSKILNEFFNKTSEEISITTGFIQRKRKLKASSFIKVMVLGNLVSTAAIIDPPWYLLRQLN